MRQARQEAGLSLAEVGRGHVTAPAIFLIETARTRPTLPTLEHIARRTGKPVEFFLADPRGVSDETQDGLVELEGLVAEGRHEEVLELGRRLLSLGSSAHRLGPIRYQIAQAYLQLGKPESAADLLRQAHAHFESVGDTLMLAECIGSEAMLAYINQEPDALERAKKGLAIARSLNPVPLNTEARLLSIVAAVYVVNREWDEAIKFYEEAIEVASALTDLRRLAQMYSGLSHAYRQQGQIEAASRHAVRSVALLEVLRDRAHMARAENELGLLLMAKGDRPAARQHLDRSLELSQAAQIDSSHTHVLLSLCELSLIEGNIEAAARFAQEALDVADTQQNGAGAAEAHMWLGRVADQQGDEKAVDREFELAIHGLGRFDAGERLLRCHGMYAEILEKRGDLQRAYVHMKKALSASRPGLLRDRSPQAIAWALLIGTFLAERASSA